MTARTQAFEQSTFGFKSERNSSVVNLDADETFTGGDETFASNEVFVTVKADQPGTLFLDFSDDDGSTFESIPSGGIFVASGVYKEVHKFKAARRFRVRFTNIGGASQTSFSLNTYYGQFDSAISTVGTDFTLQVAQSNVPGTTVSSTLGSNPDIDTADGFTDIWPGKSIGSTQRYIAPTAARLHNIVSTSTQDVGSVVSSGTATDGTAFTLTDTTATFVSDGVAAGDVVVDDTFNITGSVISTTETIITVQGWFDLATGDINQIPSSGNAYRVINNAGTGASFIHIEGLNALRLEQRETVVLNGTTIVATSLTHARINRMRNFQTGTNGSNEGMITATAQTDATITSAILAGNNVTTQAIFSVPANKDAYITSFNASLAKKQAGVAEVNLRVGVFNDVLYINSAGSLHSSGTSRFSVEINYLIVPGGAEIVVEADVDSNNMSVSASFSYFLVERGT